MTCSSLERVVVGSYLRPVKSNAVLSRYNDAWTLQTRYKLRRNTASTMKDLICNTEPESWLDVEKMQQQFLAIR